MPTDLHVIVMLQNLGNCGLHWWNLSSVFAAKTEVASYQQQQTAQ